MFSDILFDGSAAVTATIGMSSTPTFTSVSASTFTSDSTGSFAALVVDGDPIGPVQEIDGGTF